MSSLCLRKVAPLGAIMCTGSEAGKSSNPKNNKIRWMKTGWKEHEQQKNSYKPHSHNEEKNEENW